MFLMLDFETLGTRTDTVALSLGAVAFSRTGGIVGKKLFELDIDDQVRLGRTITGSTLEWWMRQDDGARKIFHSGPEKIKMIPFLEQLESFIDEGLLAAKDTRKNLRPMGKGADFDVAIASDMFKRHHKNFDLAVPWWFSNVWCYRTFANLTRCEDLVKRPEGTHHNALEDALYQTACVFAYWKKTERPKA